MINPAWKDIVVRRAAPPLKPSQQAGAGIWEQFELDRPTCFLLHHDRASSDLPAADEVVPLPQCQEWRRRLSAGTAARLVVLCASPLPRAI